MSRTTFPHQRPAVKDIYESICADRKFLHIITGPRQVGKTTAALQIAEKWKGPVINVSADSPLPPGPEWITAQWELALSRINTQAPKVLLILDEVQKVQGWSEIIKALWDRELAANKGLTVILLGSSSLLIQKGLTESLAGRFILYRFSHWGYDEMKNAFSWNLDQWIYYGGYPGASSLVDQEDIWSRYITDSLIETVLAKDVLQLQTVAKPALLRNLFLMAAVHPAQIFSYNKMLGQLQDAGNSTTLANYLKLLDSAFLITGLELFKQGKLAKRGSSPKLIIRNNALISAIIGDSYEKSRKDYAWWGRLVENAIGAHLLNHLADLPYSVFYWRERALEVDFVVKTPKTIWAIEVKSGKSQKTNGLSAFCKSYPQAKPLIIGTGSLEIEDFFKTNPKEIFS